MNAPFRKIIHCDCDCFYAAVEMRDNPALRELPVAVGGRCGAQGMLTKLFVKLRFANFQHTTVECVGHISDRAQFKKLLETGYARGKQPVRLLGLGVRLGVRAGEAAARAGSGQLCLFDDDAASV